MGRRQGAYDLITFFGANKALLDPFLLGGCLHGWCGVVLGETEEGEKAAEGS